MRFMIHKVLIVAGACTISGLCAWGQAHFESNGSRGDRFEVAVNFDAVRANTVPAYSFWMQGGGVQFTKRLSRHWGVAADASRLHIDQMPHTTAGLDLTTAVFGPRYAMYSANGRFRIYGEAMGGAAHGSNSLFPNPNGATSKANGSALLIGGGLDDRISQRFSVRLLDAGWLRTALSNGTTTVQNNLRVGSGVLFRF